MIGTDVVVAGCALALAVTAGLLVHEWTHALVLRLARVEYTIEYFPSGTDSDDSNADGGVFAVLARCPWALVRPRPTGDEPAWHLRIAALIPLSLALPVLLLGLSGHVPTDNVVVSAALIGWLACAIPSPQDFSVAFYAHRILELELEHESGSNALALTDKTDPAVSHSRAD
ncbi:hypothetical protein OB955_17445 [Halobacteria archaeon AArc-m2/3/4]|uniref:Zincin peptidase n=1 Tax=Natronoglomus mannanivorans TaxID=2979990 RepID=A0ABT2QHV0_9EURY|nr:hypothetical protein [Halobacteria archaeon AArc-m2/3/4]